MKRNVPQATGPTTATEGDETLDDTFDALADPDCRAILGAADTAMTTSELADACDIAPIELGDDGVTLTVDDSAADPVSAAFDTTSVSAD